MADEGPLRAEIGNLAKVIGPMFKQFRPPGQKPPPPPDPNADLDNYMNMPTQERQQMALQMGPEAYHQFQMQMIDRAVNQYGADAPGLYQYLAGDAPIPQPADADPLSGVDESLVAELNQLMNGALDNAG